MKNSGLMEEFPISCFSTGFQTHALFLHSRTCHAWQAFTEINNRRPNDQQPKKTKSAFCPANKPRKNRGSTAGFVPPSVYKGFRLCASEETLRTIRSPRCLGRQEGRLSPWRTDPSASRLALPCPAPMHPCALSAKTCPWYVRVLDATNQFT